MPLLTKRSVIAAKIETVYGTAIALGAADAAMNCFDPTYTANIEMIDRPSQGAAFSSIPAATGLRSGTISFSTELFGDGATGVPAYFDILMPACGMVKSTKTYAPVSQAPGSSVKSVTMAMYQDGLYKALRGAVGTFQIVMDVGKPVRINWSFTGAYTDVTDVAILAPTYPTRAPIRFSKSTISHAGEAKCVNNITIDIGNNVVLRECQTATDRSGYSGAIITDRKVTGSLNPEAELVATDNAYLEWASADGTPNEASFSIILTDDTDTCTITMPKTQTTGVSDGDRNGILTHDIQFQANRSAAAGDDEISIAFS